MQDMMTVDNRTPADVCAHIRADGSAVMRQIWPVAPLLELRSAIAGFCDRRREQVARGELQHHLDRMYSTHGVGTLAGLIVNGLVSFDLVQGLFRGSIYQRIAQAYYQSDQLYCQLSRCGFREHHPAVSTKSCIPYHQDSYSQDPRIRDVLNCWTPLDPCGEDAPGLEVVLDPCSPDFPRKDFGLASENAAYDFITIDRDQIIAVYGDRFLAPSFEVGDGFIFSQNVIHRTYVTEAMRKPRINFELRVFSDACIAASDRAAMIQSRNVVPLF